MKIIHLNNFLIFFSGSILKNDQFDNYIFTFELSNDDMSTHIVC